MFAMWSTTRAAIAWSLVAAWCGSAARINVEKARYLLQMEQDVHYISGDVEKVTNLHAVEQHVQQAALPDGLFVNYELTASGKKMGYFPEATASFGASSTPTPRPEDVNRWIAALSAVPASGVYEVNDAVDMAARFAVLAYGRNDGEQVVARVFADKSTGQESVIEIQLHATGNVVTSWFKQAHCVVYLYKLGGDGSGVGVVVSYKGSSAGSKFTMGFGQGLIGNWTHNLLVAPTKLFADKDMWVHMGFLRYKGFLDDRMKLTNLEAVRDLIEKWSGSTFAADTKLYDWLGNKANWKWTAFVGHSLGAGMAQVAAGEFAGRLDIKESDHKVYLTTLGTPDAGGAAFATFMEQSVSPHGGIRIENSLDPVTKVGLAFVAGADVGRNVVLNMAATVDPSALHTNFTIVSKVNGPSTVVTFHTPLFAVRTNSDTYKKDEANFNIRKIECRTLDSSCWTYWNWVPTKLHAMGSQAAPGEPEPH